MIFDISQDIANILNLTPFLMKIPSFWIFQHTFGPLEQFWDISIASAIHLPHDINWYNGLSNIEYVVFDFSQDIANMYYVLYVLWLARE